MEAQIGHETSHATVSEKLSFADYLQRYESFEGGRTEWLAGEVAIYPMTNHTQHQQILFFVAMLLEMFLAHKGLGKILLAGVPMYLGDNVPAREPDIMVILNEHLERIKPTFVEGIADIVIEIVSPESVERDRGKKLTEYEAAGVPEYWLIDPERTEARIYQFREDKHYHPVAVDEQGRLVSPLLSGFALVPTLLWADPLPNGVEIIALVEAMK